MSEAFDLFSYAPARPAVEVKAPPPAPEPFLDPPTIQWARRLAEAGTGLELRIMVHLRWTQEVREVLSLGSEGRWCLHKDGQIKPIAVDAASHARIVYLDPEAAAALHRRFRLIPLGGGTHSMTYRFARPGEAAAGVLALPVGDAA